MKRGNRIKSRLLSAFLVLVMLVTMVPSWAFADPVTKPQEKQMQSEATSLEGKEEDFFAEEKEGNVRETVTAEPMAVTTSFNWGMTLQALAKEEGWGFLLQAVSQNRQDTGTRYTKQLKTSVTLTLPGGLNFPEGTYTYENGVIRAGETPVVSLDSLPVTVTVTDFARRSGQELSFTLAQVRPEGDDLSAELEDIKTRILIQEEAFSTEEDSGLSAEGAVTMKASLEAVPVSGDDTIKQEQEAQAQLPDSLYEGESLSKSPVPDGDGEPTPTAEPTPSGEPTEEPTPDPSGEPTKEPSGEPSGEPTEGTDRCCRKHRGNGLLRRRRISPSVTKRPARPSSSQTSDTSSETKKKKDVRDGRRDQRDAPCDAAVFSGGRRRAAEKETGENRRQGRQIRQKREPLQGGS